MRIRPLQRFASIAACCALLALLSPGLATAHYVKLDQALVEKGSFVFGVALTGAPFASKRDGVVQGFEIDVAEAVAAAHGLTLKTRPLPRGRLLEALAAGELDAVNSLALADTPDQLHTLPYLVVGDHMMVVRGNPFRIEEPADLEGRTVAVTSGSSAESFAQDLSKNLEANGRRPMNIHSFPAQRFTHFPVSMGHAAAYFVPSVSAIGISRDPESRTHLVPGVFRAQREVGFAVEPDNQTLIHALEHALAAMVATGKYRSLLERYELPAELSPYR